MSSQSSAPVKSDSLQILLVEDSPEDALLAREALREAQISTELHHVEDGDDAIAFVRRQDSYGDAPRPDLIILDLNLPGKDGREVLEELKSDEELRRIPVVVLTTSESDGDVVRAYDHHANAYVRKPIDLDRFIQIFRAINDYWLGMVTLPPT